jgi:hypothetical protein
MRSEDFGVLARLWRRRRFANPVTEPKRSKNPKRPLFHFPQPHGYSFSENALNKFLNIDFLNIFSAHCLIYQSIDRKDVAMGSEDFGLLARLRRRRRFEKPCN